LALTTTKIIQIVGLLIKQIEALPSNEKQKFDRYLSKILTILHTEVVTPIAVEFVQHKRKYRRLIGLKILNQKDLNLEIISILLNQYKIRRDQEIINTIARSKSASSLHIKELVFLLKEASDAYWKCRIIEHLLKKGISKLTTVDLASRYPMESIRAIGRIRKKEYLEYIIPSAKEFITDSKKIGLVIWALGKIGAKKELEKLERKIFT